MHNGSSHLIHRVQTPRLVITHSSVDHSRSEVIELGNIKGVTSAMSGMSQDYEVSLHRISEGRSNFRQLLM